MNRLLKHHMRNIQPYQYKAALEEMYAEWKEFDEICNADYLPAFEDTSDNNSNDDDKDSDNNSNDITSTNNSSNNKNDANKKKKEEFANKSFAEKLKAIGQAIANFVSKIVGWFADKIGKIDFSDKQFLSRLDKAKSKGIQDDGPITTYLYNMATINTSANKIDAEFQKVSAAMSEMFDKYDDARTMGKESDDEISNKMAIPGSVAHILGGNFDIKEDYFPNLLKACNISDTVLGKDDNTNDTEGFMKAWENSARGKKLEVNENDKQHSGLHLKSSAEGTSHVNNCEQYLRGGLENTIKLLKRGVDNIQKSQKNVQALISSAIRGEATTQKANEKMTEILNGYNKYVSFVAMFYKTAYNVAIEARTNFKMVLQRAYNFS